MHVVLTYQRTVTDPDRGVSYEITVGECVCGSFVVSVPADDQADLNAAIADHLTVHEAR